MTRRDILAHRLSNHLLVSEQPRRIADVAAWFGATQAQDHPQAKYALGSRVPNATLADVDDALHQPQIVRTWTMRGTLHLIAPTDVRWMNEFLGTRILSGRAKLFRDFGFDAKLLASTARILRETLHDGARTRDDIRAAFESERIATDGFRLMHLFYHHALTGLICGGPPKGKKDTFVLLENWIPPTPTKTRDETLAAFAERYFRSHAPATLRDFKWWAGITLADADRGIELVRESLTSFTLDDTEYFMPVDSLAAEIPTLLLLAGFDEYLLAYADRSLILDDDRMREVVTINGLFKPTILLRGRVAGMWRRRVTANEVIVTAMPFGTLKKAERTALAAEAERFAAFHGKKLEFSYE